LVRLTSDAGETHISPKSPRSVVVCSSLNVAVGNAQLRQCAAMVVGGPLHATAKGVIVAADSAVFPGRRRLVATGIHLYQCCIIPDARSSFADVLRNTQDFALPWAARFLSEQRRARSTRRRRHK
jgi:hypothetical protein